MIDWIQPTLEVAFMALLVEYSAALAMFHPVTQRAKPANKKASRSQYPKHTVLARPNLVSITGGRIYSVRHLRSDYKITLAAVETLFVCCYKVLCSAYEQACCMVHRCVYLLRA